MSAKEPDWLTAAIARGDAVDASQPRAALATPLDVPALLTLELPWPPTANTSKVPVQRNGLVRMVSTKATRDYFKAVAWRVLAGHIASFAADARLEVVLLAYPPDRRRRDLGNIEKVAVDSLVKAGVLVDDSQIDDLRILRGSVRSGGKVVVTIRVLE